MHIRILLAFFCGLQVLAPPALADSALPPCVCMPAPFHGRWAGAEAVFIGTVEKIEIVEKLRNSSMKDLPAEISLHVDDAYKGTATGETFVLKTNLTVETCMGYPFKLGGKYLVFAYQRQSESHEDWSLYNFPSGTYDVGGLCGGTKPFDSSAVGEDLRQIASEIDRAAEVREKGLSGIWRKIKKEE